VKSRRGRDKKGTANQDQSGQEESTPASKKFDQEREQLKGILEDARAKGLDLPAQAFAWARQLHRGLSPEAQACFVKLCELGSDPVAIAAFAGLIRYSPHLEKIVEQIAGPRDGRESRIRNLEKTASDFEPQAELNREIGTEAFTAAGQLHPKDLIVQLRQRAQLALLPSLAEEFFGAKSPTEFSRYLLVKYVERTTKGPRDRLVSGLLTGLFDDASGVYSEENQRMWRLRHAERLDQTASTIVEYVIAMTPLLELETPT